MTEEQLEQVTTAAAEDKRDRVPGLPDSVIAAAKQLINAELDTTNPSRFHRAGCVCNIIQQLAEMYFTRVDESEADLHVMNAGPYGARAVPGQVLRNPQGNVINELTRRANAPRIQPDGLGHFDAPVARVADLPHNPEERDFVRDVLSIENGLARALTLNNMLQLRPNADRFGLTVADLDHAITEHARAVVETQNAQRMLARATPTSSDGQSNGQEHEPAASAIAGTAPDA